MKSTAEEIRKLLFEAGKTVSTAESITAGHLQAMLTAVSDSSQIFKGGITAYQRSVKVEVLGVDDELAKATDCVDEEVACQMALGALKLFKSDYAISTCGYAELEDGIPYAFYAIADTSKTILYSERVNLSGGRVEAQEEAARLALDKFNELLRND